MSHLEKENDTVESRETSEKHLPQQSTQNYADDATEDRKLLRKVDLW
jgi:hypothetical protein